MVRVVSLSVLLTLIIILGLTFFQVLAPFLLPLFLAGVFAILCQPLFRYYLHRTRNHVRLASALTTGTVVSIILIPIGLVIVLSSLQLYVVARKLGDRGWTATYREMTEPLLQSVADFLNDSVRQPERGAEPEAGDEVSESETPFADPDDAQLAADEADVVDGETEPPDSRPPPMRDADDAEITDDALVVEPTADAVIVERFTPETIRARLEALVRSSLLEMGGRSLGVAGRTITGTFDVLSGAIVAVVSAIIGFLIFVIALYYFLADGTALLAATEKLIPVHVTYQRELLEQFARVVRSVVMATFFAGISQGLATVLGLWVFGFDHLLVLLVLAILTSMIPLLGTWPIWLPCALWLLWNGQWIQALLLASYGVVIVGTLDNVVRTYILNTDAKLHPLLALISVLGGLKAMGLWGVFIGPVVASCLHALVKIFNHELSEYSQERFAALETVADVTPAATIAPPVNVGPSASGGTVPPKSNPGKPSGSSKRRKRR